MTLWAPRAWLFAKSPCREGSDRLDGGQGVLKNNPTTRISSGFYRTFQKNPPSCPPEKELEAIHHDSVCTDA